MCDKCTDGSYATVNVNLRVTISLSKEVSVSVSDYNFSVDSTEDGDFISYDFIDTDLKSAVLEQVDVPMPTGWDIEEFDIQKM